MPINLVPHLIWGLNGANMAVNLSRGLPCQMPHKQTNLPDIDQNFQRTKLIDLQKMLCNLVLVIFD